MKYLLVAMSLALASAQTWAINLPVMTVAKPTGFITVAPKPTGLITVATPTQTAVNSVDSFAGAKVITVAQSSGVVTTFYGNNASATSEVGEPVHANVGAGKSVWWSWTPTTSGTATIDTVGSNFDTVLAVYTGNAVSSLVPVAYSDDGSSTIISSKVTFTARAGTVYHIAVDGYNGGPKVPAGSITLNVTLGQGTFNSENDNYANRAKIAGDYSVVLGDSLIATTETGEPVTQITPVAGITTFYAFANKSVWWTWVAPRSGTVTITNQMNINSAYVGDFMTAYVEVFHDPANIGVSGLAWVAGAVSPGFTTSETAVLTRTVTAGEVLQIRASSWDATLGAQITLTVAMSTTGPTNDRFDKRSSISSTNTSITATNVGATAEAGEPSHGGFPATASVWWSWVAPSNGYVTMSTAGSLLGTTTTPLDTTLEAYTGSTLASLTSVASNDNVSATDKTSSITFPVVQGTTYQIAADSRGGTGTVMLTTNFLPDIPAITTQPQYQSAYLNAGPATFIVINTGATAVYDWQYEAPGTTTWVHYSDGVTTPPASPNDIASSALTVTPTAAMNGGQFRCVISNVAGQVTSSAATLQVVSLATYTRSSPLVTDIGMVFPAPPVGSTVTYYASGLPTGLTLNANTGAISGSITASAGTYTVSYWTVTTTGTVKTTTATQNAVIVVQPFPSTITGGFEGLLLDGSLVPSGKVTLLVSSSGAFTGTLTYKGVIYSLVSSLLLNSATAPTSGSVTITPTSTLSLVLNVTTASTMTASLTSSGTLVGAVAAGDGVQLQTYTTASPAPWAGTYTLAFTNPTNMGGVTPLPEGSGYGLVTISATGQMSLNGKLADGMIVTASLPTDTSINGQYRPYLPLYANKLGYLAGWLPLSPRGGSGRYHIPATFDCYWLKPAIATDTAYPLGFGPVGLTVSMEPWTTPTNSYLLGSLGLVTLSNSQLVGNFNMQFKQTGGLDNTGANPQVLPTSLKMDALSRVSVLNLTNPTGWRVSIAPSTGYFTGSLTLSDKRSVTFEGVLLQLLSPTTGNVFGRGFFRVPPVVTVPATGSILSGDLQFIIP